MFCRKTMLPVGSHQAPLYRGSRQNRLKGRRLFRSFRFCSWLGSVGIITCSRNSTSCLPGAAFLFGKPGRRYTCHCKHDGRCAAVPCFPPCRDPRFLPHRPRAVARGHAASGTRPPPPRSRVRAPARNDRAETRGCWRFWRQDCVARAPRRPAASRYGADIHRFPSQGSAALNNAI